MAKNDKVLIDGIIDDRVEQKLPSDKRDEVFEYFAFEQILKDYDPSSEEIIQGSVDGKNDGGIDGFFIFVNGHLLSDPASFMWPKSGSILEVWIITCKLHDTFKQAPLDNLVASIHELFDFSLDNSQLKADYSLKILSLRENLKFAYRKVSPRLTQFSIEFYYASRGNTAELGESIISRSQQLLQIAKDAFDNCKPNFSFLGSSQLIDLNRKSPNFALELPILKDLSNGENYILLVRLSDYYNFIQDNGKLRRYLFDSNVRDFMGLNRVNEDIRSTLENKDSPDFWWLNNGITILATHAFIIGEVIHIEDIQIVNGLQTSESIFRYFSNNGIDPNNRSLLVKVLVSRDGQVRDDIIRATNNQTSVELSSLHATDKIQRDIEDILKQSEIYYERRTNFYKNLGITSDKIVTPLYMASGYVNLILKDTFQATRLKSKFMRNENSYEMVFSQKTDLRVWPIIARILKITDEFLESVRPSKKNNTENFLKNRRQILSFLSVSKLVGSFNFSENDLINFELSTYTYSELEHSWLLIKRAIPQANNTRIKHNTFLHLCNKASLQWNIKGIERISHVKEVVHKSESKTGEPLENSNRIKMEITNEFVMKVNALLPEQPWKVGIHIEICERLNCSKKAYFAAVKVLIEDGIRYRQKNGVVYDEDGNVITFDKARVDSETLKLKEGN